MTIGKAIATSALLLALGLAGMKLAGQSFASFTHDRPFLVSNRTVSTNGDPTMGNYSNIYRWWIAGDLATGAVSSWTDRIAGDLLLQGDAAHRPTNTANGMKFSGNEWLTNNNLALGFGNMGGDFLILHIMSIDNVAAVRDLWSESPGNGFTRITAGGAVEVYDQPANFTTASALATGTNIDFWLSSFFMYTNGQPYYTNYGSATADYLESNFKYFGSEPGGFNPFQGTVREIIIWSNRNNFSYMTNPLNAMILSNIHYYATNKYGYYP